METIPISKVWENKVAARYTLHEDGKNIITLWLADRTVYPATVLLFIPPPQDNPERTT